MTDDFSIPFLSAELEDAGWLGLTAAGLLAPFMLGSPGAVSSTSTGFVWTKTLLSSLAGESVPFGIGRLKINSGSITATLGVNWYNGIPEVDLLFSLLDGNAIELEVDQAYAWLADRQTLPGDSSQIIGYDKTNPQPLTIPLPSTALEFSFRVGEDGRVSSALRTHGAAAGIAEIASGVFRWSPNPEKVIVVPKLFDAALVVQDLFIDFSDGAAVGTFLDQFPEVYDPNWKGFGATNLGLVIPVDADEFVTVGAQGFIYGFDGRFSGKCFYNWAGEIGKLRGIELGIYVRNDDIVAGDVGMIFDLADSAKGLVEQVQNAGPTGATADQQDLLDRNRDNLVDVTTDEPDLQDLLKDGLVRVKGTLVSTRLDPSPVLDPNCPQAAEPHPTFVAGIDLHMDSLTLVKPDQPELGPQPATSLTGKQARYVSWILGGAIFGPALLTAGILNDDSGDLATGIGLMILTGVDLLDYLTSLDPLPDLERLSLGKLGFRYIHVSRFDPEECRHVSEHFLEVYGDLGLRYQLDSGLIDLINGCAYLAGSAGAMSANLFGWDATHIRLKGALELELANIALRLKFDGDGVHLMPEMDAQIRRLFNQQRMQITAKDLPDIQLTETTGVEGSGKPIVSVDFVQNQVGEVSKYGIAVSLKGIGGASLSVNGAAAGLIFYFSPEFDVVFAPQVSQEPGFHFLVPPVCYAEGVIDLEKPLPGFGGVQNRIAVDVGLYNAKVKPGKKIDKEKMAELKTLKNYNYQFGGEVVWGDATGGPLNEPYDFWFVEVHYEGKTPFVTIGPLGIFGLGGLLGRNIAPGITGGKSNAVGIANWIQGSGNGAFDSVKNWPAGVPSDNTWHPARDWAKDRDLWAAGLFVKAGSADDGGKKVMVDSILMLGLPEVWVALAGYAVIKPINGRLAVVIVYDQASGSFVIKGVLSYKVDEASGDIVKVKTKFEVGTMEKPEDRSWCFLGHYLDAEGGAAEAELFDAFNAKFYYVVDSKQLDNFGLVPNPVVKRPTIPGPALGTGTLFQLGPKKYGPSWLNIQLYGGFGYNLALSFNPFLVYGDIYALGYIKLKVAFFKTKLELAARLYGLATFEAYRFAGQVTVRLNLPWPLDDVEESVDFFLERGSPALVEPDVETSAVGLYRLESRSQELGSSGSVELPIDALIGLQFNKPIYAVDSTPPPGSTRLTVNEVLSTDGDGSPNLPSPEQLREIVRTEFVDEQYEVTYTYKIDHVKIRYRNVTVLPDPSVPSDPGLPDPPPPNPWITVEQMAAVWQVPSRFDEDGTPDPKAELHHVLYLNGFLPAELQFSAQFLRRFEETFCGQYLPPCTIEEWVCLLEPNDDVWAQPDLDQSGPKYKVVFDTHHGQTTVQEERYNVPPSGLVPKNTNRLAWNAQALNLPEATRISLPDADAARLDLRLKASVNAEIVEGYTVDVSVHLRGIEEPARLRAILKVDDTSPCRFTLVPAFPHLDAELITADIVEQKCATTGETIFRFEIEALQFAHLIHAVVVEGPVMALTEKALQDLLNPDFSYILEELWPELADMELALHQFCFRYSRNERGGWSDTPITGTDADAGVDALWENQLLEPGKEYEIQYALAITGESEVLGRDEENCPSESRTFSAASGDTPRLKTFRFRTESEPSQDVARYVGFSYPHRSAQHPFYPDHLVPLLTLKDQGLIRRIYRKHYGREALHPQLVDFAGVPVEPSIADVAISSSPADCVLEELAENCLPQGEGYTRTQVNFWDTVLDTASAYALELEDSGKEPARRAYSTGFRTSRFRAFPAHVSHVRNCFENAFQIPVLDAETAAGTLSTLFSQVIAGSHPPFDDAVEAVYRRLLGINAGRLGDFFGQPGEDFVAYLTSGRNPDEFTVWGIVLELSEPLVDREGVRVDNAVAETADLARFGIQTTFWPGQSRLLLRDRAGTRLLIFNSADGLEFTSVRGDTRLNLVYSPADSLRPAIQGYVDRTWFHLTPAERAEKVEEIWLQVQSFAQNNPATSNRLNDATAPLTIPRAPYIP